MKVSPFSLSSGGVAMGDQALSFAEGIFGRRFDEVRIHADDEGAAVASRANAKAVTRGQHIYFARNAYDPSNQAGKALLAHELTHVAQMGGGTITDNEIARGGGRQLHGPRDAEHQAEQVERAVFLGKKVPTIGHLTPGPTALRKTFGGHGEQEVTKFARQHGESIESFGAGYQTSVEAGRRKTHSIDRPPSEVQDKYNVVGYTEVSYGVVSKQWGAESGPDGAYTTTTTMSEGSGASYDVIRVWALEKRRSATTFKADPAAFLQGLGGALGLALLAGKGLPNKTPLADVVATQGQPAPASPVVAPAPAQDAGPAVKVFASSKIDSAAWSNQMGVGGRLGQILSGEGGPVAFKKHHRPRYSKPTSKPASNVAQPQAQPAQAAPAQPAPAQAAPAQPAPAQAAPAQPAPSQVANNAPSQTYAQPKGKQFQQVSNNVKTAEANKAATAGGKGGAGGADAGASGGGGGPATTGKPAAASDATTGKPAATNAATGKPAGKPVVKPAAAPTQSTTPAPRTGVKGKVAPKPNAAIKGADATGKPANPVKPAAKAPATKPVVTNAKGPATKQVKLTKAVAKKPEAKPAANGPRKVADGGKPLAKTPAPKEPAAVKRPAAAKGEAPRTAKAKPVTKKAPAKPALVKKKPAAKKPAAEVKRPALAKAVKAKPAGKGDGAPSGGSNRPQRLPRLPKATTPNLRKENRAKARGMGGERPGGYNRPLLARHLPRPFNKVGGVTRPFFFPHIIPAPRKARAKNMRPLLVNEARRSVKQGRRSLRSVTEIFNEVLTHKISRAMAGDDVPEAAPYPDAALEIFTGATGGTTSAVTPGQGGAAGGVAGPKTGGFMGGLLGALKAGLSFAAKRFSGNGFGSFAADMLGAVTAGEGVAHAIEAAVGAFKGGGIKGLLPKLSGIGEAAHAFEGASKPLLSAFGFSLAPQAGGVQVGSPSLEGAAEANERAVLRMLSRKQQAQSGQGVTGGQAPSGEPQRDATDAGGGLRGPMLTPAAGGGEQLSGPAKDYVENFFGRSFSNVRIHRDSSATMAADRLQAHAFTAGNDIYFGRGEFRPDTPKGMSLLVHELTHVTQQGGGVSRKATQDGEAANARMASQMEAIAGPLLARLGDAAAERGIMSPGALVRALMPRSITVGEPGPQKSTGDRRLDQVAVEQGLAKHATALPGLPLPADVRQQLEDEIDVDLSRVRLYTGGAAKAATTGMGAEAFAKGESVVLGEKAAADLSSGRTGTLAHELEHVRQHQRREHLGTSSPLAREVLEDTAREVERRMPTLSRVLGLGEFLTSDKVLAKVADGLPAELEMLRQPKRPQPTIEPEPKKDDDEENLPDDGSNIIHQLMWYYGVRPQVGEEEFIDELTERVEDLMEEELRIERERKEIEAPF